MSKTNGELLLPSSPQGDRIRGTDKQKGTRTELVPEKWNLLNKLMTKDLGKTLTPENQYERDGTGLKTWDIEKGLLDWESGDKDGRNNWG